MVAIYVYEDLRRCDTLLETMNIRDLEKTEGAICEPLCRLAGLFHSYNEEEGTLSKQQSRCTMLRMFVDVISSVGSLGVAVGELNKRPLDLILTLKCQSRLQTVARTMIRQCVM